VRPVAGPHGVPVPGRNATPSVCLRMRTCVDHKRTRFYGCALPVIALVLFLPPTLHAAPADDATATRQVGTAIDGGLKWLAENQVRDGADAGSWSSERYHTATAAFAGLAFLANGHTADTERFGPVVRRAMTFVRGRMTPDGYLGGRDPSGMYMHAVATLFGLSYLGTAEDADDAELAAWCRKAIDVILAAQKARKPLAETGGWRYTPDAPESDLSVTSWQLLALHAARQCGFEVDRSVIGDGLRYVNSGIVTDEAGNMGFVYRPGIMRDPEPAVTGAGLCVKRLLESEPDPRIDSLYRYLEQFPPTWGGTQYKGYFYFGAFYVTQGMFQMGDAAWRDYVPRIRAVLVSHQLGDGRWPFPPDNRLQSRRAGDAYATALAVLMLSLDKQYLPVYQRQQALY